jgi:hypothetical protein
MRALPSITIVALLLGGCGSTGPAALTLDADIGADAGADGPPADATPLDGAGGADAPTQVDGPPPDGDCDPATVTPPADCPHDPFTPDTPVADWRHTSSAVMALGTPHHRCADMIYNPGQPQLLIGKFVYGTLDYDLEDENVEIWVRPSCGGWVKLGSFLTSEGNEYGTVAGVPDDGGRVFFTVPDAQALPAGTHPIKMLVKGDHTAADCTLAVWPPGTHAVVSDIDGTLTTSEYDGLWTVFVPSSPTPNPSAAATFHQYRAKGYRLVYLTARPEFVVNGTRQWFADQGFPPGIFHLSVSDLGSSGSAATAYKAGYLQERITDQGVRFDWAYGNTDTDLAAYRQVGIAADHVYLYLLDGDLQGAHRLDDYATEVTRVACLPPVTQP